VVILIIVIPIIAGVLWVLSSPMGEGFIESEEYSSIHVTAKNPVEKSYGWQLEITSVSGTLDLEDARFQVVDNEGLLMYGLTIYDSDPQPFYKGQSKVYAMTHGFTVMDDMNISVDGDDPMSIYRECYIAYIDQSDDGKVTAGDVIYIYKDYNGDEVQDIFSNYSVKILDDGDMALNKRL
jgi:hypothetical protein